MYSFEAKLVSDYTGINFLELENIPVDVYKALVRDAFIHGMQQTEQGRDYLDKCWTMQQTSPDRARLRDHFGKKGEQWGW